MYRTQMKRQDARKELRRTQAIRTRVKRQDADETTGRTPPQDAHKGRPYYGRGVLYINWGRAN